MTIRITQYHIDLQNFASKIVADKLILDPTRSYVPIIRTGRKYDKVEVVDGNDQTIAFYFVDRASGNIYGPGAQNHLYPNRHHFYGNVTKAMLWDWGGTYGKPVLDMTVKARKHYRDRVLYVPLTDDPTSPIL